MSILCKYRCACEHEWYEVWPDETITECPSCGKENHTVNSVPCEVAFEKEELETSLRTIWDALDQVADLAFGNRIGQGFHEENDDEYEEQWSDICTAMTNLRDQLGLPHWAPDQEPPHG